MEKFSVKKPYTVLVMVLIIIMLGVVSVTSMTTDLLPDISLPYMLVITTYPGASPEKVETVICEPMENALGSVNGVKNVYGMAYENYGIVELEFQDGTNMDAAMIKVSSAIDPVKDQLPEECGTPSIMEIGTDMMASEYLSVEYEGKNIEELTEFVDTVVIPRLERQDGVARISSIGLVEKTIQIEIDDKKVNSLNDKILAKADDEFAKALEQLEDAKQQIEDGKQELEDNKKKLRDSELELVDGKQELIDGQEELEKGKKELADKEKDLEKAKSELENTKKNLEETKNSTFDQLANASEMLDKYNIAKTAVEQMQQSKNDAEKELEKTNQELSEAQAFSEQMEKTITKINVDEDDDNNALTPSTVLLKEEEVYECKSLASQLQTLNNDVFGSSIDSLNSFDTSTKKGDVKVVVNNVINLYQQNYINPLMTKQIALNSTIAELGPQVEAAEAKLKVIEDQLAEKGITYTELEKMKMQAAAGFGSADAQIAAGESTMDAAKTQLESGKESLKDAQKQIDSGWDSLADGESQIKEGWNQIEDAEKQLSDGEKEYEDAVKQYEKQKAEVLKTANADALLDIKTLAQLIYAQNFAMPAGYVDDEEDNSWLVKIGDHYSSTEEIENVLLTKIDDIGDVYLKDVANVTIIDNAEDSYAKMNGSDSVILSVFKSSTSGTNEVSKRCAAAISELEEEYAGLHIYTLMDQGDYIRLIVKSVLQNIIVGAILAIIVLAFFLKDIKPTLVVAMSIPLSVLTALILMYFTDISLNIMSLSGLALGIGMLVDNSIVVIENIYRLRMRGISAARAAVQGTKQVRGSIIASTLTSVCVFFPMVFTTGTVRDLMMPISMSIIFTLASSLLIAMTLVPAAGSTLLKNSKEKNHQLFEKIQSIYGKSLEFCLKRKSVAIGSAFILFVLSIILVIRMGIVMIPEMYSTQIQGSVTLSKEKSREECYEIADQIMERILEIDEVGYVGAMSGGDTSLIMSTSTNDNYFSYSFMINMKDEKAGSEEIKALVNKLNEVCQDFDCEVSFATGMGDMSLMFGSGYQVEIYGDDLDQLASISKDIQEIVASVDGFEQVYDTQQNPDQVAHVVINRNDAMRYGLSVAQIYQEIQAKISSEASSTTVSFDGTDMDIKIVDPRMPITFENLLDYSFKVKVTDDDGDSVTEEHLLKEFAEIKKENGAESIERKNQSRYITITGIAKEGENTTLLSRKATPLVEAYELPKGYSMKVGGESETVIKMITQMSKVLVLGLALIYFIMVAQFQSFLSPFIVLFTVPLAFTGGLLGLWITGEPLSVMALMGFVILMGTVVNNGIVFVDYANQLRIGGLERRVALVAAGKTRMRPIIMTAMTTILAMSMMLFGDDLSVQMGKGMAIVISGGLLYATLMTLYIIPVMYDIFFKKQPLSVDIGSENLDDIPDDAKEYMEKNKI